MRDRDIRRALRQHLRTAFGGDPTTLVVEELGICRGTVRADVAVVNGALGAFEIKSDRDSLARLPAQLTAYCSVFDTITFVVAPRHLGNVEALVPAWCGIIQAEDRGRTHPELVCVRGPDLNSDVDPFALAQLLWRDEALQVLRASGLAAGLENKPRRYLWKALAEQVQLSSLKEIVRMHLKSRTRWRVDRLRKRGGGRFLPSATSSDYLSPCAHAHSPG